MKTEEYFQRRSKRVIDIMEDNDVDAMLVTNLINVRYLTDFPGTAGCLIVTPEKNIFFTDFRYNLLSRERVKNAEIRIVKDMLESVAEALLELDIDRIGIEAGYVTLADCDKMKKKLEGITLVPRKGIVDRARQFKDVLEIDVIKRAIAISGKSFEETIPKIKEGVTEKQLEIELKCSFLRNGADAVSFEPIILTGQRSASPHALCGQNQIENNRLLLMDFGVMLEGYMSDTTRTMKIGNPPDKLKTIYELVNEARLAAIAAVKPGVTMKEIDLTARDIIEKAGYGEYFGHGTGHGVGLEIHEAPTVSFRSEDPAIEGMVFTIEPGIYLPGMGGVRLEDMILVTKTGCEVLTEPIPYIETSSL